MSDIPLIGIHQSDDILAWRPFGPVTVRDFLGDAGAAASRLPAGDWVLNLCEDRYHFAVLFAACVITGKTSLQPASQSRETFRQLAHSYPGLFAVGDTAAMPTDAPYFRFPDLGTLPRTPLTAMPQVPADRVVAILFTSGSTGLPQAHAKTWGKLVLSARAEAVALGLSANPPVLVGTVPAQHSYGFESTFLLALHGRSSFWSGKPFYPQDVMEALTAVPRPRMLVTTPHHLATLLASGLQWPALDLCLSATASLDAALAARAEAQSGAQVLEIYGSTESGQLASRRTIEGPRWRLLPGVALSQERDTTYAHAGHVEGRVALADIIELDGPDRFVLHGRHADLVNIAGKRSSLAYLDHQLCAIEGVQDGAFFMPDHEARSAGASARLTAFVVAPQMSAEALQAALRQRVDALFLPRPLIMLDALPRNSTGKLPRAALQALYRQWVDHAGNECHWEVPVDHPAFAGHFPGQPLVPGVVLLDQVLLLAQARVGHRGEIRSVSQAKFLQPCRPGDALVFVFEEGSGGALTFSVRRDGAEVAAGVVRAGST